MPGGPLFMGTPAIPSIWQRSWTGLFAHGLDPQADAGWSYPYVDREPILVLLEAVWKGGRPRITVERRSR